MQGVRRDEKRLQFIVLEGLGPELDILVTDIRKDGGLRVDLIILACLSNDASLNVAEQTIIYKLTQSACLHNVLNAGSHSALQDLFDDLWLEHLQFLAVLIHDIIYLIILLI